MRERIGDWEADTVLGQQGTGVLVTLAERKSKLYLVKRVHSKESEAKAYFAHPYSSWERGLNENFNGLFRQYVPKGTDLRLISDEYIRQAQRRINLRPRKCLGFRQPEIVFKELSQAA